MKKTILPLIFGLVLGSYLTNTYLNHMYLVVSNEELANAISEKYFVLPKEEWECKDSERSKEDPQYEQCTILTFNPLAVEDTI